MFSFSSHRFCSRMSVYGRLTPGTSQVSVASTHGKEHPPASPLLSLASPVVKKKIIQIPSFDEKGLVHKKHGTRQTADRWILTDVLLLQTQLLLYSLSSVIFAIAVCSRSFIPVCSSKSCQHSQMNHGGRSSTLPRTKPTTHSSPTLSATPSVSLFPAPRPNFSPTAPTLLPSDSAPNAHLSGPSPPLHYPQPKPSASPTLIVPTPRLSPSPTSLYEGVSSDRQGDKQPSPVAKGRRARSIAISNAEGSSKDTRRDILDQQAFLDFTRPMQRRSENLSLLQGKSKKENISKDKQMLWKNLEFTATPKPNTNIKQQLEFLQSGLTSKQKTCVSEGITSANVVHRVSRSVLDGLATQPSRKLQRKCTDYPQNRHYAQSEGFASRHQSYQHMNSERSAALLLAPRTPFSTQPPSSQSTVSPDIATQRRRFDLPTEKKADAALLPGSGVRGPREEQNNLHTVTGQSELSAPRNIQPCHKAHSQSVQTEWAAEDYSCKSRCIDQTVEAAQCAHRLNRLKMCLVAPQTPEASQAAFTECTTSQTARDTKPDVQLQKHPLCHEICAGQNQNHNEVEVSDRELSQRTVFAPPDQCVMTTKLLKYHPEKNWTLSPARGSFSANTSGITTNGLLPSTQQQRESQRTEETKTMAALQPPDTAANRGSIVEEPEDPYYVTMYYPGSVYVGEYRDTRST